MTDQPAHGTPDKPRPSETVLRECARALYNATGIRVLNNHDQPATGQAAPAAWIDVHPQLEAIAAAVWEQCERGGNSTVFDDPRNIAVAAYAAVLPAVLREAADICDEAGSKYAARALNEHAAGAFDLMETFLRKANEAEYVATPCDSMVPCEDGGEPCHIHERLMAHAEGDHDLCEPDCGTSRMAAEARGAQQDQAHACRNCEGIDPDSCLNNPDRPANTASDDTIWLERRPCGCIVAAVVAVVPDAWTLTTAEDVALHFHPTQGERRSAAAAGLTVEPVTSAQYREQFRDRWHCNRHTVEAEGGVSRGR